MCFEFCVQVNVITLSNRKSTLVILIMTKIRYNDRTRHHNPLLFTNHSWTLAIQKDIILWKNLLENKERNFKNGVINIQAVGYNGVHMVLTWIFSPVFQMYVRISQENIGFEKFKLTQILLQKGFHLIMHYILVNIISYVTSK